VCVYIYTYIHVCVSTHTHTHAHTHHTHTHIHTLAGGSWLFLLHKDHYSQVTKFLVSANARNARMQNGPRMVLKVCDTPHESLPSFLFPFFFSLASPDVLHAHASVGEKENASFFFGADVEWRQGTSLIYTQEPEEPSKNVSCERHFAMIKYAVQGLGFS
jgi:hypothetical protein